MGTALNHLALALRRQDRLEDAERIGREALRVRQATLDPGHPDVLITMSNLALVLEQRGRYPEAESLLRERARLSAERLGSAHRSSLVASNNLAYMLWRTGRYLEAEEVFRQIVQDAKSDSLGVRNPNRPNLAIFLNNLAVAVGRRGATDEAIELQREALAINVEVLGERHPRVASDMANLASAYVEAGDLEAAEALHRDALDMRLESLAPGHVQVLESRTGLAGVLRRQGRPGDAEALLAPAVAELRERGEDMEELPTVRALHELALARYDLDQPTEADRLMTEVIDVRRRVLGPDHPDVAQALRDLGVKLGERERFEEAEEALLEAHAIAGDRLTEDDPLNESVNEELRRLYMAWGRPQEAARFGA